MASTCCMKMRKTKLFLCSVCKGSYPRATYYRNHFHGRCQQKRKKLKPISLERLTKDVTAITSDNAKDDLSIASDDVMNFKPVDDTVIKDLDRAKINLVEGQDNHDQHDTENLLEEEVWNDEDIPNYFEEIVETSQQSDDNVKSSLFYLSSAILKWQTMYSLSDRCILSLFKIITTLLMTLNIVVRSETLSRIIANIPTTLYSARKVIGLDRDDFDQFMTCPKCYSLYRKDECIVQKMGKKVSKKCSNVAFPNHPQQRFREHCSTPLLKTIVNASGTKENFYPKKIYCYRGVKRSMQDLLKRKGFTKSLFKQKHMHPTKISDIYDGTFYKSFKDSNGEWFFKDKRNIGLILNFDFFNPFKRVKYSLGVLYAVIVNLPREERLQWKNVLVLAIIPGPEEPKLTLNNFLKPLTDELLECWSPGIQLKESDGFDYLYKIALFCNSCDLPAIRKMLGFLSHNAKKGCSKCHAEFDMEEGHNRSIGDNKIWNRRTGDEAKREGIHQLASKTQTELNQLQSESGVRYCELNRLPYFDPVAAHVVDPMHNLFLGIAKHVFNTWIETKKLDPKQHFKIVDEKQDELRIPSDLGRITSSVCSHYKTMKADEWKHWALVYSCYCLHGVLPSEDLEIWLLFVNACFLICRPVVTMKDCMDAHKDFVSFCEKFQARYGNALLKPNMHMVLHTKECIIEFGPVYAFWCFGFERFNGILGLFDTNNQSISLTLMRRVVCAMKLSDFDIGDEVESEVSIPYIDFLKMSDILSNPEITIDSFQFDVETVLGACKRVAVMSFESELILEMFHLYCKLDMVRSISPIVKKATRVALGKQVFANYSYRGGSPYSYVIARWHSIEGKVLFRPAVIRDIFEIDAIFTDGQRKSFWVAKLDWFKVHEKQNYYGEKANITVWDTVYEKEGKNTYIPMRYVKERFVYLQKYLKFSKKKSDADKVSLCIKIPTQSFL